MTVARRKLIHLDSTPFYHCIARCVRRAFLCGEDKFSGKNYEHRKQWVVDRIALLSNVFAIDVVSYCVMSNHIHTVLHVNKAIVEQWSTTDVIDRWTQLYKGHVLVHRYRQGDLTSKAEVMAAEGIIEDWRTRLMDISWFMRCLNEYIARKANKEDQCTGRYWEGRFKCQALLDEAAVVSCAMYVDLNPIRAGIVKSLSESDYTSIQARIHQHQPRIRKDQKQKGNSINLYPFTGHEKQTDQAMPLQIHWVDYFELIDWTGRAIRDDKKGYIPNHVTKQLDQLGVNHDQWLPQVKHFESRVCRALGSHRRIKKFGDFLEKSWLKGIRRCNAFYQEAVP